ncbi:DL-endopeptidase inhibitor IseA family protein [Bacillus xiapuensis]|uniref:DL-endopeptidase inhibitor IseA family protein n=1 Tax=Bacillus xiapuensis TaxID=2014075 RepID=A0ABU6N6K9_9BACI|nr:DL-endopeptidase inhibitor IseA family protein [Bacillus xiapuensis]
MFGSQMKKWVVPAISMFLLSSCNLFPEPESLIQVPKHVKAIETEQGDTFITIASKFLPKGTTFLVPNGPVGADSVQPVDLDGDGKNELVVFYSSTSRKDQVGFFVLKKDKKDWGKIFIKKGTGYAVNWANTADVTGDKQMDLLIGWQDGISTGNTLEIYSWKKNKLVKLQKLNYHELEALQFKNDSLTVLAIWQRDLADVYKVQLLKWTGTLFDVDKVHESTYFHTVIDYYQHRTEEVPDAAYYWYYLADAHLKANHPELALAALGKGMRLHTVVPSYSAFVKLKEEIDKKLTKNKDSTVLIEYHDPNLSFRVPTNLAPFITTKGGHGENNSDIVSVLFSPDQRRQKCLFSFEIFTKDLSAISKDSDLVKIGETKNHLYYIRRGKDVSDDGTRLVKEAISSREQMIASVKIGAEFQEYYSLENENVIQMAKDASIRYWYALSGGKMKDGKIDTFHLNDLEYRYLGSDLETKTKLFNYLSKSYTFDAIETFMKKANILEHNGRLVQPNADGGSMLNYDLAKVVQKKDNGEEKEFDIKVPLGDSYSYEVIHIGFQKTDSGWRIFSNPGAF